MGFDGMTQVLVYENAVVVTSPYFLTLDEAFLFQIRNNPLHCSLGDPDQGRDFPENDGWIAMQEYQNM